VYALALPPLLIAAVAAELAVLGDPLDIGSPLSAARDYLATLLLVAALGGGQEEPGWRGYAQTRFQARWPMFRATLLLGTVWGAWHLPVYGLGGFAGPLLFIWFYSWLYNRTRSVLLCVLLHAGLNTAVGYVDLAQRGVSALAPLAATALVAAAVLVWTTGGLAPPRRLAGDALDDRPAPLRGDRRAEDPTASHQDQRHWPSVGHGPG
jgi:membrane protease YdiL (CAAX protease family)